MAKRSNGEGSLRRRADGRWQLRVMDGYLSDGRPHIVYFYGHTQKEVRAKVKEFELQKAAGIDTSVCYTFSDWADFWYENHRYNITATTQESYRYTLKVLKEHFGRRKLNEIKAYDIEQFLRKLQREDASKSRLSQCRGMLFQIFNKAEANDLILKNPVRFAEKTRTMELGSRKEAFTADEVRLMMEKLPYDRMGVSIRLMLGTGMRSQELLGLEPKHIAEDGSVIQIRQAVKKVKGSVVIGPPKSRDSYRDVPVPPNLRFCAVQLRQTDKKFIWEAGIPDQPCNPDWFRRKFKEAIEAIDGVRVLTPHSCRHTYVSQMQALGVDLPTIQSIVGHADIDMTQHYLHVQDNVRQQAVERFSEAFGNDHKA